MRDIDYDSVTDAVLQAYDGTSIPRLKVIIQALIPKLHDLVREVEVTKEEWVILMDFLLAAAKNCSDQRNDFILLSDLLGVSAMVDLVAGKNDAGATSATLLGPFYVPGQKQVKNGADLIADNDGERVVVRGRITSTNGDPLPGAALEIWQNAPNGLYTMQDADQADDNLRCILHADDEGRYFFSTVRPAPYKVREDGAGGKLVKASGWHSWRPAHIHFIVSADGHKRHVSQIFDAADPHIDEDAVFGVRADLVVSFDQHATADDQQRYAHVKGPFSIVDMDWVLAPAA